MHPNLGPRGILSFGQVERVRECRSVEWHAPSAVVVTNAFDRQNQVPDRSLLQHGREEKNSLVLEQLSKASWCDGRFGTEGYHLARNWHICRQEKEPL